MFHRCSFLNINANMERQSECLQSCFFIARMSFFLIQKICLTASVFHFLKPEELVEEIYASVFTLIDFGRRPQVCEFFDRCCTMRTDVTV